jgi:hypothetical protein
MMSFATIGGILLIIGAFFTYKGNIHKSVMIYMLADIIWIILGIMSGDYIGALLIFIGAVLGLLAWMKMNSGIFNKTLY